MTEPDELLSKATPFWRAARRRGRPQPPADYPLLTDVVQARRREYLAPCRPAEEVTRAPWLTRRPLHPPRTRGPGRASAPARPETMEPHLQRILNDRCSRASKTSRGDSR